MLLDSQTLALVQLLCVGVFVIDGKREKNCLDYNKGKKDTRTERQVSCSDKEDNNHEEKGSLPG